MIKLSEKYTTQSWALVWVPVWTSAYGCGLIPDGYQVPDQILHTVQNQIWYETWNQIWDQTRRHVSSSIKFTPYSLGK